MKFYENSCSFFLIVQNPWWLSILAETCSGIEINIRVMEQSISKRRNIKFRRRGITQKKEYNIRNTAKVWNQAYICRLLMNGYFRGWYWWIVQVLFVCQLLLWTDYDHRPCQKQSKRPCWNIERPTGAMTSRIHSWDS